MRIAHNVQSGYTAQRSNPHSHENERSDSHGRYREEILDAYVHTCEEELGARDEEQTEVGRDEFVSVFGNIRPEPGEGGRWRGRITIGLSTFPS